MSESRPGDLRVSLNERPEPYVPEPLPRLGRKAATLATVTRVRLGRRQSERLLAEAPSTRRERAGHRRPRRQAAVAPALPGRTHDLTAARTHRIIRICERQGVPILADRAYIGAGPWVTTPIRRLPNRDLTTTQRTINRAPVGSTGTGRTKHREAEVLANLPPGRCSPNRMTVIAAAILALERQHW